MLEAIAKVITDAVRSILFMLDQVVYGFIPTLYKLIISLANVDLYNNNAAIMALLNRVYIIVGVFMLFKLAFSVLRYIIDPGSFSDQAKGFTGLVRRVLIAMILLVTIPWLFSKMYEVQGKILESNIISNMILGTSGSATNQIENSAKDLQFMMFGPFYSLNTNTSTFAACEPDSSERSLSNIIGTNDMALKDGCLDAFSEALSADDTVKASGVTLGKLFRTSDDSDGRDFNALGGLLTWTVDDGAYAINYTPVISTICGGYLAFLLVSFCIDVAARAIKLLFLQVLSPVAIIMSVDPSSSSQNDKLKDWGSECLKTYVSLFLRLAVIYTVIQVVKIVTSKIFSGLDLYNEGFRGQAQPSLNIFVYIFLILGVFSVAKKIPELIEKAFGIKFSGEINMNPFKNEGFNILSGGIAGGVAGAVSGGISAFSTSMNQDKGLGRSLASAAGGAASGSLTGTFRGTRAKGLKGWEAGSQSGGRIARRMEVRAATGGIKGVRGMAMDRMRDKFGAPTTYESMEAKAKRYDEVGTKLNDIRSRAVDQLSKKSNEWKGIQAQRTAAEQWLREGKDASGRTYTHSDYVRDINSYYSQEQILVADYIDHGGIKDPVTGVVAPDKQDGQLMLYKQALEKAIKDTNDEKLIYETDSSGKVVTGLDGKPKKLDIETTSWKELGADGAKIKTFAEQTALGIRSEPGYNDAHDRHQAIHGARLDAHQKH